MSNEKEIYSPADIMGAWRHSHEEDPPDDAFLNVFRPKSWSFRPSRGRFGFELRKENFASIDGIAPGDGTDRSKARWRLEYGNVLVITDPGGMIRRLRIEKVEPDRLLLRVIHDSN